MKKSLYLISCFTLLVYSILEFGIVKVMFFILKLVFSVILFLTIILYLLYLLVKMIGEFFEERDNRKYDEEGNLIITDKMQ